MSSARETETSPARFDGSKWIVSKNERNLCVMMDVLEKGAGEGRFGLVYGEAGRGKTRTTHRYASHNRNIHLLMRSTWKTSELGLLQALCRELGVPNPPARKDPAFTQVVDRLLDSPRVVFLDEMEKLPRHLDLVRELAELTGVSFVLIGENELVSVMQRNKRVWSRTYQMLHFDPVSGSDIVLFAREAAGLEIDPDALAEIKKAPGGGDWRVVRRTMMDLIEMANIAKTRTVNREMAMAAMRMGLSPSSRH